MNLDKSHLIALPILLIIPTIAFPINFKSRNYFAPSLAQGSTTDLRVPESTTSICQATQPSSLAFAEQLQKEAEELASKADLQYQTGNLIAAEELSNCALKIYEEVENRFTFVNWIKPGNSDIISHTVSQPSLGEIKPFTITIQGDFSAGNPYNQQLFDVNKHYMAKFSVQKKIGDITFAHKRYRESFENYTKAWEYVQSIVVKRDNSDAENKFLSNLYELGYGQFKLAKIFEHEKQTPEFERALIEADKVLSYTADYMDVFLYVKELSKQEPPSINDAGDIVNRNLNRLREEGRQQNLERQGGSGRSTTVLPDIQPRVFIPINLKPSFRVRRKYGLEAQTIDLLQQVHVALHEFYLSQQRMSDASDVVLNALLTAEAGRAIEIDNNIFYNLDKLHQSSSDSKTDQNRVQRAIENASFKLNIEDIQKVARQENATIVNYSIISTDKTLKLPGSLEETFQQKLLTWVIKPSGQIILKEPIDIPQRLLSKATNTSSSCDLDRGRQKTALAQIIRGTQKALGVSELDTPGENCKINEKEQDKYLQELYNILIKPIENLLPVNPDEHVIFVPQNELFFVPFPALKNANGQYFIEQHTIRQAPNLRTLVLNYRQNQKQASSTSREVLIVGDPSLPEVKFPDSALPTRLPQLQGARSEAETLAKLAQEHGLKVKLFTGSQATKKLVVQQIPSAWIIHIAAHGILNNASEKIDTLSLPQSLTYLNIPTVYAPDVIPSAPNIPVSTTEIPDDISEKPANSSLSNADKLVRETLGAIVLSSVNKNKNDNGLLTAGEILGMRLNADLVVLSACGTGQGYLTAGGVVGLPLSLSFAGVPNIVVSLWRIPDAPTEELMKEFYRQLLSSTDSKFDKARALRRAMISIKNQEKYRDPRNWAGFTIIGGTRSSQ